MIATSKTTASERIAGPEPRLPVAAELLDLKAVARLLGGCSTRHIYRLSDGGKMPRPLKLGALLRWRRADLEAWIAAGCPSHQPAGRRS